MANDYYIPEEGDYRQEQESLEEQFHDYLYKNYIIGNGDMLTRLEENTAIQDAFLSDRGLSLDTEIYK